MFIRDQGIEPRPCHPLFPTTDEDFHPMFWVAAKRETDTASKWIPFRDVLDLFLRGS